MIDLSTFLSQHPHLPPDSLRKIEAYRSSAECEVQNTSQCVQTRKLSPYTGEDLGPRLTRKAEREIEDTVIAFCSRLYEAVAMEYLALPNLPGDLTSFFENLAGAVLRESDRLFRNATAGMWFESIPSLEQLRLHEELKDKTPFSEIADYVLPEPWSLRVRSVLVARMEALRPDFTTAALGKRNRALSAGPGLPDAETAPDPSCEGLRSADGADAGRAAVAEGELAPQTTQEGVAARLLRPAAQPPPDEVATFEKDRQLLADTDRVTFDTAARILRVGKRRVRQLAAQGQLETIGCGQLKRISTRSIRKRLDSPQK